MKERWKVMKPKDFMEAYGFNMNLKGSKWIAFWMNKCLEENRRIKFLEVYQRFYNAEVQSQTPEYRSAIGFMSTAVRDANKHRSTHKPYNTPGKAVKAFCELNSIPSK